MKKYSKLMAVLLVLAMLIPGLAQVAEAAPAVNTEFRTVIDLNLRTRPDDTASPVIYAPAGSKVSFLSVTNNGYFHVTYEGKKGYVLRGDVTSEANYTSTDTTIHPRALKDTNSGKEFYVVQNVSLRTGDSNEFRSLEVMKMNQKVKHLGTTDKNWFKVDYKGTVGYVYRGDVTSSLTNGGQIHDFPLTNKDSGKMFVPIVDLALRTGNTNEYKAVIVAPRGAELKHLGTTANGWFKLEDKAGNVGYAYRGNVTSKANYDALHPATPEVPETPGDLTVKSVSAINEYDLKVTLSDGSVHEVSLKEALKPNVPTKVTFTIDKVDYTATVTFEKKAVVETLEEELVELEADLVEAEEVYNEKRAAQKAAKKALEDAKIELEYAKTPVEKAAAQEKVDAAQKAYDEADTEVGKAYTAKEEAKTAVKDKKAEIVKAKKDLKTAIETAETYIEANVPARNVTLENKTEIAQARNLVNNVLELDSNAKIKGIEKLEAAEAKIAEIRNDTSVEQVKTQIVSIKNNLKAKNYSNAEAHYNNAIKELKKVTNKADKAKLETELEELKAEIDEGKAQASATTAVAHAKMYPSQDTVDAAQKAIDKVNNKEAKQDLQKKLDEVKETVVDKAAADKVSKMINELPATSDLKLEDKEDVEAARAAYEALTKDQKAMVEHADWIKNNEDKIKDLEQAKVLEDAIKALPKAEDVTYADKAAIDKVIKDAEADADVWKLVSKEANTKYFAVKAALKAIEDMDLTMLGYQPIGYAEVQFVGFKISDTEKIEFALYQGNTKQRTITAKETVWEDLKDNDVIGGNLKAIDPKYWDYDGEFGEGVTKANQIKVTITLKNGRVLKADKSL